jgi:hypothetical protein
MKTKSNLIPKGNIDYSAVSQSQIFDIKNIRSQNGTVDSKNEGC